MRKIIGLIAGTVLALSLGATAIAGQHDPHQVLVCKYVGTPGVDERLQTGQNPIVVDTHSLSGFDGTFPFEFNDAQGRSVAIRWLADDESPSDTFDISECGAQEESPSPTPTESPSESESSSGTPSPSPSETPSSSGSEQPSESPTPSPTPESSLIPPVFTQKPTPSATPKASQTHSLVPNTAYSK